MDFSRIKQLVKRNGDRVILVENDQPEIVVMSFQEYEKMANHGSGGMNTDERPAPAPERPAGFGDDFSSLFDEGAETDSPFNRMPPASASFFARPPAPASSVRIEDVMLDDLPLESPLP